MSEHDQLSATQASEGDLAGQWQVAAPESEGEVAAEEPPQVPLEADPADAIEQQRAVPEPDYEP